MHFVKAKVATSSKSEITAFHWRSTPPGSNSSVNVYSQRRLFGLITTLLNFFYKLDDVYCTVFVHGLICKENLFFKSESYLKKFIIYILRSCSIFFLNKLKTLKTLTVYRTKCFGEKLEKAWPKTSGECKSPNHFCARQFM